MVLVIVQNYAHHVRAIVVRVYNHQQLIIVVTVRAMVLRHVHRVLVIAVLVLHPHLHPIVETVCAMAVRIVVHVRMIALEHILVSIALLPIGKHRHGLNVVQTAGI